VGVRTSLVDSTANNDSAKDVGAAGVAGVTDMSSVQRRARVSSTPEAGNSL
jgi:hypothetical protein